MTKPSFKQAKAALQANPHQDAAQEIAQEVIQQMASVSPVTAGTEQDGVRAQFEEVLGKETVLQAERLVKDTVNMLQKRRAYFRDRDILRLALNMSQKEVDPTTLGNDKFLDLMHWAVAKHPLLPVGNTGFLTTQAMWDMENAVIDLAGEVNPEFIQPRAIVDQAVDRKKGISEEQILAVHAAALSPRRITVIEGTAGAGKTFTMEAVKEIYAAMGYDVMGTALGWAAAKVLGEGAKLDDEKCVAIEGLTRSWLQARSNGTDPFQGPTLLIVDEAGMVGTRHMSIILQETRRSRYPVKVILTGDSLQVIPVDAGNALEAIIEFHGTTRIDTIRRQHQPSHRKAVKKFSERHSGNAIHTFLQQECFRWCQDKDDVLNMVVRDYLSYRIAHPEKKALVLACANKDVLELNHRIRAVYKKLGLIDKQDVRLNVTDGRFTFECNFSVGDEVLLRANDKNMLVYEIDETKSPLREDTWKAKRLGVFNRNAGRIVAIRRAQKPIGSYDFIVDMGGDTPGRVVINSATFKHSDREGLPMLHNYATTIYGSQGQTVSQVFLVDSQQMDFRLAYVGMSRHKEGVTVYLDETDLHRRLDQTLGKRQSLSSRLKMDKQGKSLDDAVVETGRYTRSEMLRAVSLNWGKHSENLTAVLFERIRRLGQKAFQKNEEALAAIKPASAQDTLVDFIPEYNTSYPLVDVAKILELPDPVEETQLVRPSDVEINKERFGVLDMPVDAEATPIPAPARSAPVRRSHDAVLPTHPGEEPPTFFGRAIDWLMAKTPVKKLVHADAPTPIKRLPDAISAFEDLEGLSPPPHEDIAPDILAKLNAWLRPKSITDVPYQEQKLCGHVIYPPSDPDQERQWREEGKPDPRPHGIDFDGVPQVANVEGGPDPEWIAKQRGVLWDIGRGGEPRILARSPQGEVVARYRFNGECAVGEGQPPVIVNTKGSATSPVYIVAGAKEWLWLRQTMEDKHKDNPAMIPHIIWAAQDMDWKPLISSLKKSEKVVIVRSKADDRQLPWALSLQELLQKRYHLAPSISPPAPQATPPAPSPSGRFRRS